MMQGDPSLIEIIIPNLNGRALLSDCLQSLRIQTFEDFRVTVVDNGSKDGSAEMMKETFPEVNLIALPENLGFAGGVNRGIRAAASPLILLLNNDIEMAPDCLEKLVRVVQDKSDYSSFALKMLSYHQRDTLDGAGDAVLRGGVGYRLGTMEKDTPLYDHSREVFGACAGAALYRREFFETVGLFDEDFFAYLEDVDLNMRARRLGLTCYYVGNAVVFHVGSATSGSKINSFTVSQTSRNNLFVLLKNYPAGLWFRFFPAICIYQFFWLLFVVKKMKLLSCLVGWSKALLKIPLMLAKRKTIEETARIDQRSFAAMVTASEAEVIDSIMARRSSEGKTNGLFHLYRRLLLPGEA